MFLTKKGFRKILFVAIGYFVLGSYCIAVAMLFSNMGMDASILYALGVIAYVMDVLFVILGRFAEGEGKLINLGNKLVRSELRPAEFLKEYESLKNSGDLVIKKPSFAVLQLVAVAYDSLDDRKMLWQPLMK